MCPGAHVCVRAHVCVWGGQGMEDGGWGGGGRPCVFPPPTCCHSSGAVIKDEGPLLARWGAVGTNNGNRARSPEQTDGKAGRGKACCPSLRPPSLFSSISRPCGLSLLRAQHGGHSEGTWMTTRLTDRLCLALQRSLLLRTLWRLSLSFSSRKSDNAERTATQHREGALI